MQPQAVSQSQRVAVGVRQNAAFARHAIFPNGANRVNHESCAQPSSAGLHRFAGRQVSVACHNLLAFFQDGGASGAMNGAIHSTSAHQAGICRVDDGVSGLLRDVPGLEEDLSSFSEVKPNDVFHFFLLVGQRFHAGKFLAFEEFKRSAAAGGNVGDLIGHAGFMYRSHAVAPAYN